MHRLARTGAVLATTAGMFAASTGAALAHYCYKEDKKANNAAANSEAWVSAEEALAMLPPESAVAGAGCPTDVYTFLNDQGPEWRMMWNGVLARGTQGTDRTPEHFGYLSNELGELFGCLESAGPPA